MRHAIIHLEEEMRVLLQTWREVRIDLSMDQEARSTVEAQTAREIRETQEALRLLRNRMGAGHIGLSPCDLSDIRRLMNGSPNDLHP